MAEYIDREAVFKAYEEVQRMNGPWRFETLIESVPAEDVAPVVHGKWGEYESFPLTPSLNGYPCSNCGMHFSASSIPILKYCPNCGAKMDL